MINRIINWIKGFFVKKGVFHNYDTLELLWPGVSYIVLRRVELLSTPPNLEFSRGGDFDLEDQSFIFKSGVQIRTSNAKRLREFLENNDFESITKDIESTFNDLWYYYNSI